MTMLTELPAVLCNVLFSNLYRFFLEWCCHGVIPAVHETELSDQRGDFDNLALRPLQLHPFEHLIAHVVGL